MINCHQRVLILLSSLLCLPLGGDLGAADNLLHVTIDGLRWQEVFGGLDRAICDPDHGGVSDCAPLVEEFWKADREQRARALLPFLWSITDNNGVLLGDVDSGSEVTVTNGRFFSYPGYHELLSGFPADEITSNAKINNPHQTMLEWLNRQPGFEGQIAAVGSWDVFPFILNQERSGLPVNAGWQLVDTALLGELGESARTLNYLMERTTQEWPAVRFDSFTGGVARELVKARQPRVLYLALGEPDDWAHARKYDRYLRGAALNDQIISELWTQMQALPRYRNNTALIVTTDHGRGPGGEDWTSHGANVAGADQAWMLLYHPGGLELPTKSGTLAQTAATAAALLGVDYRQAVPKAAPSLVAMQ